jgi:hypothetical protein
MCKRPSKEFECLLGECINMMGESECRCPVGTYGYPGTRGGCIKSNYSTTGQYILPLQYVGVLMQQCNYMLIGCSVLYCMMSFVEALSATASPVQVGLPNCNTACGDVRVPYPFGFGPSNCYWPGLNLTCDTSRDPPRLLLHTHLVLEISLSDSTMRVIKYTDNRHISGDPVLPDIDGTSMMSSGNEMIVFGCTEAKLYGEPRNGSNITDDNNIISRCFANCSSEGLVGDHGAEQQTHGGYCSGRDGCCHAPIPAGSRLNGIQLDESAILLISEDGLTDEWYTILNMTNLRKAKTKYMLAAPIVLVWAVKQGLSAPDHNLGHECTGDVHSRLCKSKDSYCRQANGGFTCYCSSGYHGNPYIADGCQGHL